MGSDGDLDWGGSSNTAILGGHPPTGYDVVYHSRNRVYAPDMGRFISSDPNGTGVPVLDSMASGGMAITPCVIEPDWQEHYRDGMNAHSAYGANPTAATDSMGLYTNWSNYSSAWDGASGWDPFDMVDEYMAEDLGSKAAFVGRLFNRSHTVAYISAWMISWTHGLSGMVGGAAIEVMGTPDELQGTMALDAMQTIDDIAFFRNVASLTRTLLSPRRMLRMFARIDDAFGRISGQLHARYGEGWRASGASNFHGGTSRPWDLYNVRELPDSEIAYRPDKKGNAPYDKHGKRIQIHHEGQEPYGPFTEMTQSQHRSVSHTRSGIGSMARGEFNLARTAYWVRQWLKGRFNHLPPLPSHLQNK